MTDIIPIITGGISSFVGTYKMEMLAFGAVAYLGYLIYKEKKKMDAVMT